MFFFYETAIESTDMRSDKKACISGLSATDHARNRLEIKLYPISLLMTVGDLGKKLHSLFRKILQLTFFHKRPFNLRQCLTNNRNKHRLIHKTIRTNTNISFINPVIPITLEKLSLSIYHFDYNGFAPPTKRLTLGLLN